MRTLTPQSTGRPAKAQQVCARLRSLAHRLGPDAKFPTVQELRQEMGVSLGTLNSALREAERQNILTRRHSVGIYVSPSLQKNVALICNPAFFRAADHSPFWDLLLSDALEPAHGSLRVTCHFAASASASAPLPPALMEEIASGQVDGVLAVSIGDEAAHWIKATNVPFVHLFGAGHVVIMPDLDEGARLAARTLAQQGCTRPGMWQASPRGAQTAYWLDRQAQTQAAFAHELKQHGVAFDPARGILGGTADEAFYADPSVVSMSLPEQGFRLARRVFSGPPALRPDGIFVTDDTMTRGALSSLQKTATRVRTDVRIVSHANRHSPVLLGHEDELARVEYDPAEFVNAMFSHLNTLMSTHPALPEEFVLIAPRVCTGHADA